MEIKYMTPLTQIELNTTSGGDWDWGEFLGTVGWFMGAGCGVTGGNPAVCGAAIAVNGFNLFFL